MSKVRYSPVAGSWYKGTKGNLIAQVRSMFRDGKFGPKQDPLKLKIIPVLKNKLTAIISPHAGLSFSGYTAAHGYLRLKEELAEIDTVIVMGPNHRGMGSDVVFTEGIWEFPIASLKIDEGMIEFVKEYKFQNIKAQVTFDDYTHSQEHSIDIQFPFIQYIYGDHTMADQAIDPSFTILPICLGNRVIEPVATDLAKFLYDLLDHFKDRKIAIVASSDFSHEHDYNLVERNDKEMIDLIKAKEFTKAEEFRTKVRMTMCGYSPIFTLLKLSEMYDTSKVEFLNYSNSSGIRGDPKRGDYCVGYASFMITAS